MEVDDAEVMRRLVEAGFGWSILPEFALRRGPRFFEVFRVPGHKVMRSLALIMVNSERPRALTASIAQLLQSDLAAPRDPRSNS
jgi:DNA-binding transcriptional LysR family regulator